MHYLNGSTHLLSHDYTGWVVSNDGNQCLQAYTGGISVLSGIYLKIDGAMVSRYIMDAKMKMLS